MREFEHPLQLVSPMMTGKNVEDAQWLLHGHNRFAGLAPLKDAKIDGIYGPVTAQATKSAKYWLGYPQASCDLVFGQKLYEYLRPNKWRPLPVDYRERRELRLALAAETPGKKALAEIIKYIGYQSPSLNWSMFNQWYHMYGAWCAMTVSYCFDKSGYKGFHYSYVPAIYDDARAGRNHLKIVNTPQVGDLVLVNWPGERLAHVGILRTLPTNAYLTYVSGNTNGGRVESEKLAVGNVNSYVRVGERSTT